MPHQGIPRRTWEWPKPHSGCLTARSAARAWTMEFVRCHLEARQMKIPQLASSRPGESNHLLFSSNSVAGYAVGQKFLAAGAARRRSGIRTRRWWGWAGQRLTALPDSTRTNAAVGSAIVGSLTIIPRPQTTRSINTCTTCEGLQRSIVNVSDCDFVQLELFLFHRRPFKRKSCCFGPILILILWLKEFIC